MLEYLILDMGNVLLDFDPGYALAHFCPDEESREIIRKALFEGPWWIAGDRGDITNEERYARVSPEVPEKYREALALCVDRWDECMVPLSGAREFLAWARKKGLGLYVLSNACSRFYSYFPKQLPLSMFDGVVVSSREHLVKPDTRLYQILLSRFSLAPEKCLFIDDSAKNVAAAEALGIHGHVFDGDYSALMQRIEKEKRG